MGYYVDIENIKLDEYKAILRDAYIVPSRAMLKEDVDKNIDIFKGKGNKNVADLQKYLESKANHKTISHETEIDEKYLNALRLELNAYIGKPTKIKDFVCLSDDVKSKFEASGIKNAFDLYHRVFTADDRKELSNETGVEICDVLKAAKLADLTRIRWVNHNFAYLLFMAGYDTVKKVSKADYEILYNDLILVNKMHNIYKGNIGLNDMKLLVVLAGGMPTDDIIY